MVENLENMSGIGIGHNFPHDSIDMNWGPIAPWKPEVQTLDDFDLRLGRLARAPMSNGTGCAAAEIHEVGEAFGFPWFSYSSKWQTPDLDAWVNCVVKVSDDDT